MRRPTFLRRHASRAKNDDAVGDAIEEVEQVLDDDQRDPTRGEPQQ